jgi:hypothetical protein
MLRLSEMNGENALCQSRLHVSLFIVANVRNVSGRDSQVFQDSVKESTSFCDSEMVGGGQKIDISTEAKSLYSPLLSS